MFGHKLTFSFQVLIYHFLTRTNCPRFIFFCLGSATHVHAPSPLPVESWQIILTLSLCNVDVSHLYLQTLFLCKWAPAGIFSCHLIRDFYFYSFFLFFVCLSIYSQCLMFSCTFLYFWLIFFGFSFFLQQFSIVRYAHAEIRLLQWDLQFSQFKTVSNSHT